MRKNNKAKPQKVEREPGLWARAARFWTRKPGDGAKAGPLQDRRTHRPLHWTRSGRPVLVAAQEGVGKWKLPELVISPNHWTGGISPAHGCPCAPPRAAPSGRPGERGTERQVAGSSAGSGCLRGPGNKAPRPCWRRWQRPRRPARSDASRLARLVPGRPPRPRGPRLLPPRRPSRGL